MLQTRQEIESLDLSRALRSSSTAIDLSSSCFVQDHLPRLRFIVLGACARIQIRSLRYQVDQDSGSSSLSPHRVAPQPKMDDGLLRPSRRVTHTGASKKINRHHPSRPWLQSAVSPEPVTMFHLLHALKQGFCNGAVRLYRRYDGLFVLRSLIVTPGSLVKFASRIVGACGRIQAVFCQTQTSYVSSLAAVCFTELPRISNRMRNGDYEAWWSRSYRLLKYYALRHASPSRITQPGYRIGPALLHVDLRFCRCLVI